MKYSECIIAYDEGGPIEIGLCSDKSWSNRFDFIIDGVDTRAMPRTQQVVEMLAGFINACVRDRVALDALHLAYCVIDEYRTLMTERSRVDETEKNNV